MPIIGTAGHVDHGKSTLIEALTGRDPDRWAEEKRRGLTIDLGFAWATIGGLPVGFVDVPGHERFVKNMLAGIGAVDAAILVVAADEGWMPQTEEHAAVLDLLGTPAGVIALTRIDIADPTIAELAEAEIAEKVEGTLLGTWPVVPVSAMTGEGLDDLRDALSAALTATHRPEVHHPARGPRMWVDRAFTVGGAGLIVTGTLLDGPITRGDSLWLTPAGATVKVRTIQSHETESEVAEPGSRTALNITGVAAEDVARGSMVSHPGAFRTTGRILADLQPVRSWPGAISDRGAHHIHAGSGHWPARVRLLDQSKLDRPGPAVITLDGQVPLRMGDRFILREAGRRAVVGGGVVLDPAPGRQRTVETVGVLRGALTATTEDGGTDLDARASALLQVRQHSTLDELAADTGGGNPIGGSAPGSPVIGDHGDGDNDGGDHGERPDQAPVHVGPVVMTFEHAAQLTARMLTVVDDHHTRHPRREGIPKATLASAIGVDAAVIGVLAARGAEVVDGGAFVRRTDFTPAWTDDDAKTWRVAKETLLADGLNAPRLSSLGLDAEQLHVVVRNGWLVSVGDDLAFLPEHIATMTASLANLPEEFTVSDLRDELGVSRRQAVPIAEWLDKKGWTSRHGDVRKVRRLPPEPTGDAPPR